MLNDDRQVALNDVIEACWEAADLAADAAGRLEDRVLADLVGGLAVWRRTMAESLGDHIRRIGDAPKTPDSDREALEELWSRIKTTVSDDPRIVILEERVRFESRLADLMATALDQPLPSDTLDVLRRYRDEIAADIKRLEDARATIA